MAKRRSRTRQLATQAVLTAQRMQGAAKGDRPSVIANAVLVAARDLEAAGVEPIELHAPLAVAADVSASTVAKAAGLPTDDETVELVKRYLLAGFRELTLGLDADHFRGWAERRAAIGDGDP